MTWLSRRNEDDDDPWPIMLSTPLMAEQIPVEWKVGREPVPYENAVRDMEQRVEDIRHNRASELVWLLEHPPLYTAGTSAKDVDLLDARLPVFKSGRGGQYTYHGPGQRIAYVMLDLRRRKPDARAYVHDLEEWLIQTLARFGVKGERRTGRIGVWVTRENGHEDKIAAIGVRLRHWITFHGISLNVDPDLSHFEGIVPCGVRDQHLGVTSLAALGRRVSFADVDAALKLTFAQTFGPVLA
jgi:lipoyl(octanoyl) transferase